MSEVQIGEGLSLTVPAYGGGNSVPPPTPSSSTTIVEVPPSLPETGNSTSMPLAADAVGLVVLGTLVAVIFRAVRRA